MSRSPSDANLDDLLAAAAKWKDRCLLADGSVFTSSKLWTRENVDAVDQYFVQNPQSGRAPFLEKLHLQIETAPPQVCQLLAEQLWILLLFSDSIGGERKRENILQVWSWSGQPLDATNPLLKVLDFGIGGTGQGFNSRRPSELSFLVKLMQRWKALETSRQIDLLANPWSFGNWVDAIPKAAEPQFRHMLLYLLFPDTYERICSRAQKRGIEEAFSNLIASFTAHQGDSEAVTLDRQLQAIRAALQKEYPNTEIDFYTSPIKERWRAIEAESEQAVPDDLPQPSSATSNYSAGEALEAIFLGKEEFEEILDILRSKRNLILQGPPGVGKSFIAHKLAYALIDAKDHDRIKFIQFHQSYSYEDFIEGFRPTERGEFTLKQGLFRTFCAKALNDLQNKYVLVIDEINRGNLSKIFGELLLLIEHDKRKPEYALNLTYSDARFYVPPNLYLIGLMNTADRSLAMVDYALRRRFSFYRLKPMFGSEKFKSWLGKRTSVRLADVIASRLIGLNETIEKDRALGEGFSIGHSFFCPDDQQGRADEQWYRRVIETEIEPLINEYWFDKPDRAQELIKALKAPL
jgi:MoxR-like ATPase